MILTGWFITPRRGEYHMYQSDVPFHTQYAVEGNNKSWGHAVSRDLVNWEVFKKSYRAGRERHDMVWLHAWWIKIIRPVFLMTIRRLRQELSRFYTYYGGTKPSNGLCSIGLAYSLDGGYTFIKPFSEPIIPNTNNMYQAGMRDPKGCFGWKGKTGEPGRMGDGGGRRTRSAFTSADLINWNRERELCFMDGSPMDSECPDIYPLAVDGG